ncbi:MAG TPA: ATP-binding cassette domain-containing protein [Egibacteraceae bacterium]|nr:ATP-binding cassette domain-containing protein [Egibacteraceae bacterium]
MGELISSHAGSEGSSRAWRARSAAAALAVAVVAAPIAVSAAAGERGGAMWLAIAAQALLLAVVASSWNIVGGYLGSVDIGHAAYFGLGAYGTGVAMASLGWGLPGALATGAVLAAAVAAGAGAAVLRLHGATFAIATLGVLVVVREIVRVAAPLTGGGRGLTLPPPDPDAFYYAAAALFALAVALSRWLRSPALWPLLVAMRDDEQATAARGVPTMAWKSAVFAAAAAVTGTAGGLWAYHSTFIDPDLAFADAVSVDMITAVLLGGVGTVAGPIVGSAILYGGRWLLWPQSAPYHVLLQGLVLIAVVRWMPRGVVGGLAGKGAADAEPAGLSGRAPAEPASAVAAEDPGSWAPTQAPPVEGEGAAREAPGAASSGEMVLDVEGLRVVIEGAPVLNGVDLQARRGEIIGVVGPNGSGKTTLVDCLSGLRHCDAGRVCVVGADVTRRPSHRVARSGLARTFQVRRVYPQLRVIDNLLLCARRSLGHPLGRPASAGVSRATALLAELGLEEAAQARAAAVSAGQQSLLEIGMALMLDPDVLVLDEATAGVAPADVAAIKAVVRSCAAQGKAVLVVEHHVGVLADLCHRVVVLDRGRVVAQGTAASVMSSGAIETAYFGTAAV